jgi:hypothetical protein
MDPDSDPDPDPAIFIIDLQDTNKKLFKKKFFLIPHGPKTCVSGASGSGTLLIRLFFVLAQHKKHCNVKLYEKLKNFREYFSKLGFSPICST